MVDIYYKDESYKIRGLVNKVYNHLGYGYQEKYYYKPIKIELINGGFEVQEQLYTPLMYESEPIGAYYLDFLINQVIVLEIKVADEIYPRHIRQVLGYLKAHNLKLGIIAVITKNGVKYKRVVN